MMSNEVGIITEDVMTKSCVDNYFWSVNFKNGRSIELSIWAQCLFQNSKMIHMTDGTNADRILDIGIINEAM
jgi:hypothetical protein